MAEFGKAFGRTVGLEGKYSDQPNDRGGPTMYGITQAEARAHGYDGDMRAMPITLAMKIYRDDYWNRLRLDELTDQLFAEKLFDTAVNTGRRRAVTFLQVALNGLNLRGKLWPDQAEDGYMGPAALSAFAACLAQGGTFRRALSRGYVSEQGHFYLGIGRADQSQEDFEHGWLAERCWLPE